MFQETLGVCKCTLRLTVLAVSDSFSADSAHAFSWFGVALDSEEIMRRRTTWLAAVSAILFAAGSACAQDAPASGLYQIISGRYTEYGGFVGTLNHTLPEGNQTFVELTVDSAKNLAQMKFLGQDMRTIFSIPSFEPCCGGVTFKLGGGGVLFRPISVG